MANEAGGELKSRTVANATAGDEAVAKTASTDRVANSKNSIRSGKKRTTATVSLKREQSLQILRDCVDMVRGDGVAIEDSTFTSKSGKRCVVIILEDVDKVDGDYVYVGPDTT